MSEISRMPKPMHRLMFVVNPDEETEEVAPRRHPFAYSYPEPAQPRLPSSPTQLSGSSKHFLNTPPPLKMPADHNNHYQRSNPTLSSPSSTSSPAGETPPPSTPGLAAAPPELSLDSNPRHETSPPPDRAESGHNRVANIIEKVKFRLPHRSQANRRQTNSPSALSPDTHNTMYNQPTRPDKIIIMVTADSERYHAVDITGVKGPAPIRERMFTKLCVADEDQRHYSIYRTEINEYAIGDALGDEQLYELCREHGDDKGALKFFVSHGTAPVHAQPSAPLSANSPTMNIMPPPVPPVIPYSPSTYHLRSRQPRSRQDSFSSASECLQPEANNAGYEASNSDEVDHVDRASRTTVRPPMAQVSGLSSSPHSRWPNGLQRPTSPKPHNLVAVSPPQSNPPPSNASRAQVSESRPEKYSAPPPLSPNRATFNLQDEARLVPLGARPPHSRAGSDAAAEREIVPQTSEASEGAKHWRKQQQKDDRIAREWPKDAANGKDNQRREKPQSCDSDEQNRSDWVIVITGRGHDKERSPNVPPETLASPTAPRRGTRDRDNSSSPRFAGPAHAGRTLIIPTAPRAPLPPAPTLSHPLAPPPPPTSSADRGYTPTRTQPHNWIPSSESHWTRIKPKAPSKKNMDKAKSMDNIRTAFSHPTTLQPGRRPGQKSGSSGNPYGTSENAQSRRELATGTFRPPMPHTAPSVAPPLPRPLPPVTSPLNSDGLCSESRLAAMQPVNMPHSADVYSSSMHGETAISRAMRQMQPSSYEPPSEIDKYRALPTPASASLPGRPLSSTNSSSTYVESGMDSSVSPPNDRPMRSPHSPRVKLWDIPNGSTTDSQPVPAEPRHPISSPVDPDGTLDHQDKDWAKEITKMFDDLDQEMGTVMAPHGTVMARKPPKHGDIGTVPPPPPTPHSAEESKNAPLEESDSDGDSDGSLWFTKPQPVKRPKSALRKPPLTVHIELPATHLSTSSTSSKTLVAPPLPTRAPPPPPLSSAMKSSNRSRGSTFTDMRDHTWAPRPPPEDVYDRLEDFFPNFDLDQPVIDASSGGTSPTAVEQGLMPSNGAVDGRGPSDPSVQDRSRVRAKKSIRIVAQEHKKRIDRTSRAAAADSSSAMSNVMRKRSTKLWGSRLEEVTQKPGGSIPVPESPSAAPKPIFRWVRGELIGKGTYGRVYLALNATTGEMIAVKQVEIPRTASDKNDARQLTVVQALKSESETLKDLDHPNIVTYLGFEETMYNLSIFLEYVPGGSIGSCLQKHGKFDEEVTKSFTGQILSGLDYLHSKGILHRDLKADNILVETSGVCKISDFGISKRTDDMDGGAHTAMQGTIFYMAPEVISTQKKGYNFKIDIWSVGCVILEMWTGQRPWKDEETVAVMLKLYESKLPPVPSGLVLSELGHDFRNKCFAINPDERPPAAELRRHPYLELPQDWAFNGFKQESTQY